MSTLSVGARFYSLSRFAPPCGHGESRNRGVLDVVGDQTQYLVIDPSAGVVGAVIPVFGWGRLADHER